MPTSERERLIEQVRALKKGGILYVFDVVNFILSDRKRIVEIGRVNELA